MQRPLKRGILGASTIILSKGIDKYAFLCGLNLYETVVTIHFNTSFHSEFHSESHSEFMRQNVKKSYVIPHWTVIEQNASMCTGSSAYGLAEPCIY